MDRKRTRQREEKEKARRKYEAEREKKRQELTKEYRAKGEEERVKRIYRPFVKSSLSDYDWCAYSYLCIWWGCPEWNAS